MIGKINKVNFLDKIENHWASEKNPRRTGYFIRKSKDTIELTDGKGNFWKVYNDSTSKNEVVGHYLKDITK